MGPQARFSLPTVHCGHRPRWGTVCINFIYVLVAISLGLTYSADYMDYSDYDSFGRRNPYYISPSKRNTAKNSPTKIKNYQQKPSDIADNYPESNQPSSKPSYPNYHINPSDQWYPIGVPVSKRNYGLATSLDFDQSQSTILPSNQRNRQDNSESVGDYIQDDGQVFLSEYHPQVHYPGDEFRSYLPTNGVLRRGRNSGRLGSVPSNRFRPMVNHPFLNSARTNQNYPPSGQSDWDDGVIPNQDSSYDLRRNNANSNGYFKSENKSRDSNQEQNSTRNLPKDERNSKRPEVWYFDPFFGTNVRIDPDIDDVTPSPIDSLSSLQPSEKAEFHESAVNILKTQEKNNKNKKINSESSASKNSPNVHLKPIVKEGLLTSKNGKGLRAELMTTQPSPYQLQYNSGNNELKLSLNKDAGSVQSFVTDIESESDEKSVKKSRVKFTSGVLAAILISVLVVLGLLTGGAVYVFHRWKFSKQNKPVEIKTKTYSPEYVDDNFVVGSYINRHIYLPRPESTEEMNSLDNDSFLNSLEAVTIQNYWADSAKNTRV